MAQIEMFRPLGGPVGEALSQPDPGGRCAALIDSILLFLDQDDGWTWTSGDDRYWLAGGHPTRFRYVADQELGVILVDTVVAESVHDHARTLLLLNELNVHAAGWFWWVDDRTGRITASMRTRVQPAEWWWSLYLLGAMGPYVTTIESVSRMLAAACDGQLVTGEHPERGARTEPDGWIAGTRLGPREPVAGVGIPLLTHERRQLRDALETMLTPNPEAPPPHLELADDLGLLLSDAEGNPTVALRQGWHPEMGWGVQLATLPGTFKPAADNIRPLLSLAARLNQGVGAEQQIDGPPGAWVATEHLGLVQHLFVPAVDVERAISHVRAAAGTMFALMTHPVGRLYDAEVVREIGRRNEFTMRDFAAGEIASGLRSLWSEVGPPERSYLAEHGQASPDDPDQRWLLPRHGIVCCFGSLSAQGATVKTLEFDVLEPTEASPATLYLVVRHPVEDSVQRLGEATDQAGLARLVEEALADTGALSPLGTGPEWMEIFDPEYLEAVRRGLRRYAESWSGAARDWAAEGADLEAAGADPWRRIGPHDPQPAPAEAAVDPVGYWIAALTAGDVVQGAQLYVRSAWEAAIAALDAPDDPNAATDVIRALTQQIRIRTGE